MRCGRLLVVLLVMGGLIAACSTDVADIATDENRAENSAGNDSSGNSSPDEDNSNDDNSNDDNSNEANSNDSAAVIEPEQSADEQVRVEQVDEDAGNPDDDTSAADTAGTEFSVLASLSQIPLSAIDDEGVNLQVSIADVDAATDQARLRRPLDSSDTQDLIDFFNPLTGGPVDGLPHRIFVPLPSLFVARGVITEIEEFVDEVGFSPGDVTAFVSLEAAPVSFTVLGGVSATSGLPEVAPGVRTFGEGEDFEFGFEDKSVARPLGQPLRVSERDETVALSTATGPLVEWAGDDSHPTLADQPVLARLATRLDEENVVSAFLLTADNVFEGAGLGWEVEEQPTGVIVLAYGTEELAQEQAPRIEAALNSESVASGQPMAELVTVDTVEVRGSEIVVTVRFPDTSKPIILLTLLVRGDVPFGPVG